MHHAAGKFGKPLGIGNRLRGWMEVAGFVDIQDEVYKVKCSPFGRGQY